MNADKVINVICLVLWITQLVFGILAVCGVVTVSPIAFICAVLICILHYIEKIVDT